MLRLTNSNYPLEICQTVLDLRSEEMLLDCRLLCMDGTLQCSKLLLSANSCLLCSALLSEETEEILLLDFSLQAVRILVDMLYGENPGDKIQSMEFLELTDTLGVNLAEYMYSPEEEEYKEEKFKGPSVGMKQKMLGKERERTLKRKNAKRSSKSAKKRTMVYIELDKENVEGRNNLDEVSQLFVEDKYEESPPKLIDEEIFSSNSDMQMSSSNDEPKIHPKKSQGQKHARDSVDAELGKNFKMKYASPSELQAICTPHIDISQKDSVSIYTCDLCGYIRKERAALEQHIGIQHMKLMTMKCHLCNQLGNDLYHMEKHMNGHGYTREKDKGGKYKLITNKECTLDILEERFKPFHCEFCSKLLRSDEENRKHQESCGGGVKNIWYTILSNNRYECKLCSSVFKHKLGLKSHLSFTHHQTLPFVCDECGDSFITDNMMQFHRRNTHQRRSRSTRPFIGNYHLKEYITYLPKDEAEAVLPSYFTSSSDGEICRICDQTFSSQDIRSHLLRNHLKLCLYKCELCNEKLIDSDEYQSHIQTQHNVEEIKTVELPTVQPGTEFVFVQDDESTEADQDTNVAFVIHQNAEVEQVEDAPPASTDDHVLYKDDRPETVEMPNPSHCKEARAQILMKKHLYKPVQSKLFYCLVCNKEWSTSKYMTARDHIFQHFNLFPFKCDVCNELFKVESHLKTHMECHQEKRLKVGNYETLTHPVFIPWKEAKPILDTYFRNDEENRHWCLLCEYSVKEVRQMRIHLLTQHLKINVFKCQECGQELAVESEIRKHYRELHNMEFDGLEKVEDPEYESEDTDFPDEDIRQVEVERLRGRKVSTSQGRILRRFYLTRNETEEKFECRFCHEKKETLSHCGDHVMANHLDVYMYRCNVCNKLMRNWSIFSRHRETHRKQGKKAKAKDVSPIKQGMGNVGVDYHLLEEDVFVGSEEGSRIVREYMVQMEGRTFKCKLCDFSSLVKGVEAHVFARHLTKLYLYKCEECGKMFRYSKTLYRNHIALHTTGRLTCTLCTELGLNQEKTFTKESLIAHNKRFHCKGGYVCKVETCSEKFPTPAHLKNHERSQHFLGLPQKNFQFMCQICQHSFPTSFQLQSHLTSCQAGRSRTLFRQLIADCLTWEGKGVYSCRTCGEKFYPPRPTTSSLPLARKHVVTMHNKTHLRKTKMSWTQGVEGLNSDRKASRNKKKTSKRDEKSVSVDDPLNLEEDQDEVDGVEVVDVVEAGDVETTTIIVPEQIPSSIEVVI